MITMMLIIITILIIIIIIIMIIIIIVIIISQSTSRRCGVGVLVLTTVFSSLWLAHTVQSLKPYNSKLNSAFADDWDDGWLKVNKLSLNVKKTHFMLFTYKKISMEV